MYQLLLIIILMPSIPFYFYFIFFEFDIVENRNKILKEKCGLKHTRTSNLRRNKMKMCEENFI